MVASPHPLVEKMTLFWHGHFTSKLGGAQGDLMLQQNQMFRRNALGNFRTLTQQVSRDPAMLQYLNGNQNYKAHPNENYGRELMSYTHVASDTIPKMMSKQLHGAFLDGTCAEASSSSMPTSTIIRLRPF